MAKKKRLSRDQKRKAKLSERARKGPASSSQSALAYSGNKYKTDELIPVIMHTETAIHEMDVMTDRTITDHTVRAALEKLVLQMRGGSLPALEESDELTWRRGHEADLIVEHIRRSWDALFRSALYPGDDNLVGVLRTILDSINTWSTPAPTSRGYLNYIEGFLRKLGVNVRKGSARTMEELPEPEDSFLELGHAWCKGDLRARAEFLAQAEVLIASGKWQRVVDVAQRLMGELVTREPVSELGALSLMAQKAGRPRLA
jgi:hypothetical protein